MSDALHETWDGRKPMKVVGRQKEPRTDLVGTGPLLRLGNALRPQRPLVPRGVYRFRSFEEADKWMLQMTARA